MTDSTTPPDPDSGEAHSPQSGPPATDEVKTARFSNRDEAILNVYSVGETTVVGFGGRDVLDGVNLAVCREELVSLLRQHNVSVLAFDLTGVILVPSGLLGLLASMRQQDVEVHIYNPSDDVREVLDVTHLDELMPIHEVELSQS